MNFFRHIGLYAAVLTLCAALDACSGGSAFPEEIVDGPVQEEAKVNLLFSVAVSDAAGREGSRAGVVAAPDDDNYFESEVSEYESLRTLRVIILRPDGPARVVEHNRLVFVGGDGSVISDRLDFPVTGGEKKTVYLIANEPDSFDFSSLVPGNVYVAGTLESLTLSPAAGDGVLLFNNGPASSEKSYIPMGEVYDVYVPRYSEDKKYFDAGTMFVTRAAVKFSFNVTALYGDGLYLKNITVNGLADREYLLPHETEYFPPKPMPGMQNPPSVAEPGLNGHFITSYSIPSNTVHGSFTFNYSTPVALSKNTVNIAPELYFCESMLGAPVPAPDGAPYTVGITLTDNEGSVQKFNDIALPNLPILPRNTHVKVNITLAHSDIYCEVEVVPYTGVWLDPGFGIERP